MFGIPLALLFGALTFLAWRRGWRGGALATWAVLFGLFLGGAPREAVVTFVENIAYAAQHGASAAATELRR